MNRRDFLGSLALLGLTSTGVFAQIGHGLQQVQFDPIYVNRKGNEINIRVTLHNPGISVHTRYDIRLLARAAGSQDWEELKAWHEFTMPNGKLSRDYIPVGLPGVLTGSAFQLRTELSQHGTVIRSLEQNWPA